MESANLQVLRRLEGFLNSRDLDAYLRLSGHGTESGVPFDQWAAFVFTIHDRRVTRVHDLGREGLQASTK